MNWDVMEEGVIYVSGGAEGRGWGMNVLESLLYIKRTVWENGSNSTNKFGVWS